MPGRVLIRISSGFICLTVWQNESVVGGEATSHVSFTLDRSYKDKDDKWQHSTSFFVRDLLTIAAVCSAAHDKFGIRENPQVGRPSPDDPARNGAEG